MGWRFKNWLIRITDVWREERASLDLEWRIFAQAHNAAGKRPMCWYPGMDEEKGLELDPKGKVEMYEFPLGPDSKDQPIDPDCLSKAQSDLYLHNVPVIKSKRWHRKATR